MNRSARIEAICRYPVKGLSAESLASARLAAGETIAADRLYAVENGPSGFDPAAPAHVSKLRFLMLVHNGRLARLRTRFDPATHLLAIELDGSSMASGDLRTPEGRAAIERFFAHFCADELRGPPRVLHADGHSFSNIAPKVVSIINLASLTAIEDVLGASIDPLRFRANLYVAGWPAWHEFSLIGRELRIGSSARVRIVKRIQRCAATEVDPATAARDLPIPRTLLQTFGHGDCGVYAEVVADGEIALADGISDEGGQRTDDG